jgi:hypothetical protein
MSHRHLAKSLNVKLRFLALSALGLKQKAGSNQVLSYSSSSVGDPHCHFAFFFSRTGELRTFTLNHSSNPFFVMHIFKIGS